MALSDVCQKNRTKSRVPSREMRMLARTASWRELLADQYGMYPTLQYSKF